MKKMVFVRVALMSVFKQQNLGELCPPTLTSGDNFLKRHSFLVIFILFLLAASFTKNCLNVFAPSTAAVQRRLSTQNAYTIFQSTFRSFQH